MWVPLFRHLSYAGYVAREPGWEEEVGGGLCRRKWGTGQVVEPEEGGWAAAPGAAGCWARAWQRPEPPALLLLDSLLPLRHSSARDSAPTVGLSPPQLPPSALSAWVGLGSQTPRATALKWGMPSPPVRGKEGVGLSGGPLASPSCCCSGLGPFVGLGCLFLPAPWGMRWGQGLLPGERGQGIGAPSHPRADRAACGPWSCQVPNTRCLGRLRAPLAATGSSSRGPLGQPAGQTRKGHGPACPASCHGAPGLALCRAEEGLGGPVTGGSSQASCCSTLI